MTYPGRGCRINFEISKELINVLSGHGRRYIAVLWVYLDESGTHKGAPLLSVAGYMGCEREWHEFEKEWCPHLKKANVPYFHAIDPKCSSLKPLLASAITKRNLRGIICSIKPDDYKLYASSQFKGTLGNAYAICAFMCALHISDWAKDNNLGSVSFIIEAGQPNADHVEHILKSMINDANFNIAGVMMAKKDEFIPLQTADFISHVFSTTDINDEAWLEYLVKFGQIFHVPLNSNQIVQASKDIKVVYMKQRNLKERNKRKQKAYFSKL